MLKAYHQGMAQLIDFDIRSIVVLPDQCGLKRGRKDTAIVIVGDGPLEP